MAIQIMDISISSIILKMGRKLHRDKCNSNHRIVPEQWTRIYGKTIEKGIKNKNWELRKYLPTVVRY